MECFQYVFQQAAFKAEVCNLLMFSMTFSYPSLICRDFYQLVIHRLISLKTINAAALWCYQNIAHLLEHPEQHDNRRAGLTNAVS